MKGKLIGQSSLIGIILFTFLGYSTGIPSKVTSTYRKPIGGFLLPHPEFDEQNEIPLPQHFENFRATRSIKDLKQRQIVLDKSIVRAKRSPDPEPQFSIPKVRGKVGTGGLNLNVDTSPLPNGPQEVIRGNAGLNVEGGLGNGNIGAGLGAALPNVGASGKLSVGGQTGIGAGASLNGAIPQIGGGLNVGGSLPKAEGNAVVNLPNLSGGVTLPSLGGEVGLGNFDGSLKSDVELPKLGGELNANLGGGLGAGINTNLNIPNVEGEVGVPNLGGNVNLGANIPAIPTNNLGGELNANLGGIGAGAEVNTGVNIPKLEGELAVPNVNGKLDLGASIPKIPTGKAEIAIPNLGLNVLGQRQRGEKAASIRTDDSLPNSLTSPSPRDAPSSLTEPEPSSSPSPNDEEPKESGGEDPLTTTSTESERTGYNEEMTTTTEESEQELTTTTPETSTSIKPLTTTTEMPENDNITVRGGELYLPENYNILEIPQPNYGKLYGLNLPGPLPCLVFLNILGVGDFNELEEKIAFDADLTVEWIDSNFYDITKLLTKKRTNKTLDKIRSSSKTLSPQFLKKIWRPDLYFENLIKVDQPTVTNKAVLSLKYNTYTGFFSYTVRMTIHVQCPMSFEYYPADTQVCEFRIGSYSHGNKEMQLRWLELSNIKGVNLQDPSENNFDLKIHYIGEEQFHADFNNPLNETHDILTFAISGRRKLSYHLIQTYLPSIFHIFITWLVFLIPYSLYDCRIGTTMTTLLTLTAMFSAVRESAPVVNYIKAIDIWMLACVFFVFLNLVELTLMTWMRVTAEALEEALSKLEEDEETGNANKEKKKRRSSSDSDSLDVDKVAEDETRARKFRKVYTTFAKYSFYGFAGMFILFNLIYWIWLMTASEYLAWTPAEDQEL